MFAYVFFAMAEVAFGLLISLFEKERAQATNLDLRHGKSDRIARLVKQLAVYSTAA